MNTEKFVGLIILALSMVRDILVDMINFLFNNYMTVLLIIFVICFINYTLENPAEEIDGCRGVYIQFSHEGYCCSDCKELGKIYFKYNSGGWAEPSCWCFTDDNLNNTVRIW